MGFVPQVSLPKGDLVGKNKKAQNPFCGN